jgi:GT2 family glycosyltransferase
LAVESVVKNSAPHKVNLYLLDNGSKAKGVHEYMKSIAGAVVIRNETNRWVYGGWNQLLARALGDKPEYVCLMSNDVQVAPGWLPPMIREMDRSLGRRYLLPNGNFPAGNFEGEVRKYVAGSVPLLTSKVVPGRSGWLLFFRAEDIPLFYPIPETLKLWYGDDWIHWSLKRNGFSCLSVMDSCALHYGSKTLQVMDQSEKVRIIAQDKVEYRRLTGEDL